MTKAAAGTGPGAGTNEELWAAIAAIPDPEVPVLTIEDLGILRDLQVDEQARTVTVLITPTYSGCPAMDAIRHHIEHVARRQGYDPAVQTRLTPAWTTDWMTVAGRDKLRAFGIAPPGSRPAFAEQPVSAEPVGAEPVGARPFDARPVGAQPVVAELVGAQAAAPPPVGVSLTVRRVTCPLCGSAETEEISRFGSTACKAMRRCKDCREPFDEFKAI